MPELSHSTRASSWRTGLDIGSSLLLIATCVAVVWITIVKRPTAVEAGDTKAKRPAATLPLPAQTLSLISSSADGQPTAPVAIVEYTDYQCPFCGRFARETLPDLKKTYIDSGKARFVVREMPLESIHQLAFHAAVAAQCAGKQGHFWKMHDLNFANQALLDADSLRLRARSIGVNEAQFSSCLSGDGPGAVREEIKSAKSLGVTGTPTFFLGAIQSDGGLKVTQRLVGAVSLQEFSDALERVLRNIGSSSHRS